MTKAVNPGSSHAALDRFFDGIGQRKGASPSDGVHLAADFLGVTHSNLRKQIDPDHPSELAFVRVTQLTRHFAGTEAAEHLALCAGGVFVPMPHDRGHIGELTAEAMREMGEAVAKIFASTAAASEGGVDLTPREARDALVLVGDALAALTTLYSEISAKAGNGALSRAGRGEP